MGSNPDIVQVTELDEMLEAYAHIIAYFPPRQVLEVDWFINCIREGSLRVWTCTSKEGILIGTIGLYRWALDDGDVVYQLCFQAVHTRYRDSGVGTHMFHHALQVANDESQDSPIVAFVTHPDSSSAAPMSPQKELYGDAEARFRFYTEAKHGHVVGPDDQRLLLPQMHRGLGRPKGQVAISLGENPLTEDGLRSLLSQAYLRLEGVSLPDLAIAS